MRWRGIFGAETRERGGSLDGSGRIFATGTRCEVVISERISERNRFGAGRMTVGFQFGIGLESVRDGV